jgi:glycosyltransferase involved in cell wall biosynthesis
MAYLRGAVALSDREADAWTGHSNQWESREIAKAAHELGYGVDVIDFNDHSFQPDRNYDLVLAIDGQLGRLADAAKATNLLLHVTGSYPPFHNAAEQHRLEELAERRGVICAPRRVVEDSEQFVSALEAATACSLLGNVWTLSTFPESLRAKLRLLPVTASRSGLRKTQDEYVPDTREFLWFFGSGAVHKGLDRVLEAFARNPDLTLNVIGNISEEHDFVAAYDRELTQLANIRWHGYLEPASRAFDRIVARCVAFVAPSCSESISTAAATMLQVGLYPILSRETGISLPSGAGMYLECSSVDEIDDAVNVVFGRAAEALEQEIEATQSHARSEYSRERFAREVRHYLRSVIA